MNSGKVLESELLFSSCLFIVTEVHGFLDDLPSIQCRGVSYLGHSAGFVPKHADCLVNQTRTYTPQYLRTAPVLL